MNRIGTGVFRVGVGFGVFFDFFWGDSFLTMTTGVSTRGGALCLLCGVHLRAPRVGAFSFSFPFDSLFPSPAAALFGRIFPGGERLAPAVALTGLCGDRALVIPLAADVGRDRLPIAAAAEEGRENTPPFW